jgi:2-polyprenyl-3-methyl-5-hydroxy-6-metoxy-1,4-benzoquinol methylase
MRMQADRLGDELRAEMRAVDLSTNTEVAGLIEELSHGDAPSAAAELSHRFAHAENYTNTTLRTEVARIDGQLADLRAIVRFTQATVQAERDRVGSGSSTASNGRPEGDAADDPGAPGETVPAPSAPGPARAYRHPTPSFDMLYTDFEHRLRGPKDEIRDRQQEDYLAFLRGLPSPELPVVDLGCGRGELVSLLAEARVGVLGVDANAAQVFDSAASHVEIADLFDWLDDRDDSSTRAIVSLHVVEHLPLDEQVRLVHEARRVLAPGGALILETPNATSIVVGASTFWVDPTHERPVHPEFLRFLAEDAGFVDVETRLLHAQPLAFEGPPGADKLVADLNGLILGPADVSLIARTTPEEG